MATLDELWRSLFPAAAPVSPLTEADRCRDVGWVRVLKARIPAFDALESGDLAVIAAGALAALSASFPATEALVDDLGRAGVSALLLVGGADEAGPVELLAAEATEAGLPAFRLPSGDTSQLERAIIGYLVNRRAELDRQAARLETMLEETALRGGGPDALVATAASFLGRAVALEGRRGDVLAAHAPLDAPEAAAAVARYMGGNRRALLRVPLPPAGAGGGGVAVTGPLPRATARAGVADQPPAAQQPPAAHQPPAAQEPPPDQPGPAARAAIVLLGRPPVSELERVSLGRVAGLVALEVARDSAVRDARDAARDAEPYPADGPPWVVLVARQGVADASTDGPGRLDRREEARREIRLIGTPRRLVLRGDVHSLEIRAVLAADETDRDAAALSARIAAFLRRTVAISRPFTDTRMRGLAEAEARATLEAAERLPDRPAVARGDRLPAYRLMGDVHNLPGGLEQARALLAPLLAARPDVLRERLATLRAVLEQPGVAEAAAALGVHRNTIAYRIRRYEQLTGWRLGDPELRLPLAIAVRLVQTEQQTRSES